MPIKQEDTPGLLWSYRFDGAGKATNLEGQNIPKLGAPGPGFIWLHFDLVDRRSALWIERQQNVPESARHSLLSVETYQRLEHIGPLLFGALADAGERSLPGRDLLRFVMGPNYLITGQRHALESLRSLYEGLEGAQLFTHPSSLLEAIVQLAVTRQRLQVERLTETINEVEDRVLDGRVARESEDQVAQARRQLVHLHRNFASLDALFRRFSRYSAEYGFPSEVCDTAQRIVQQIQTLHADIHALQERARLMRDEIESQQSREMNNSLFILSVLSALLLPPSLIFSYFGINAGGLPLTQVDLGWLYVLVAGAVSSYFVYRYLRRRRSV